MHSLFLKSYSYVVHVELMVAINTQIFIFLF